MTSEQYQTLTMDDRQWLVSRTKGLLSFELDESTLAFLSIESLEKFFDEFIVAGKRSNGGSRCDCGSCRKAYGIMWKLGLRIKDHDK